MADPRDPYNEFPERRTMPENRSMHDNVVEDRSGTPWGWIAGGIAIALLLLVFAFGTGNDGNNQTATTTPPATTGSTPPATSGQAPATRSNENTGQTSPSPSPAR